MTTPGREWAPYCNNLPEGNTNHDATKAAIVRTSVSPNFMSTQYGGLAGQPSRVE